MPCILKHSALTCTFSALRLDEVPVPSLKPRTHPLGVDEPIDVYSYIRVSTAREVMISPANQEHHNERWAAQNNLRILEHIYDLDESGRDFARRKVGWMIDQINEGRARGVIVWQISRWGRNMIDSLLNLETLEESGGKLYSSTEPMGEMDTPMGRFNITMMLGIAQLQSDQIRQSWIDTQDNRRRKGLPHCSQPRFGYVLDREAGYSKDPISAPWLARFYEQFVAGRPLSKIVADANNNGITGTNGKPLTTTGVRFILDSGFGAGKIARNVYRGVTPKKARPGRSIPKRKPVEYLPGAHAPHAVISEATWAAYLECRQEFGPPRDRAPVHRLAGLLRCGGCNRRLYRCRDNLNYTYACRNTRHNSMAPCPARVGISERIAMDAIEEWIAKKIEGDSAVEDEMKRAFTAAQAVTNVKALEASIVAHEKAKANLIRMRAADEITADELRDLRQDYDVEIAAATSRLATAKKEHHALALPHLPAIEALAAVWHRKDNEETMNKALRAVIHHITVMPKRADGALVPSRERLQVHPHWEVEPSSP